MVAYASMKSTRSAVFALLVGRAAIVLRVSFSMILFILLTCFSSVHVYYSKLYGRNKSAIEIIVSDAAFVSFVP